MKHGQMISNNKFIVTISIKIIYIKIKVQEKVLRIIITVHQIDKKK